MTSTIQWTAQWFKYAGLKMPPYVERKGSAAWTTGSLSLTVGYEHDRLRELAMGLQESFGLKDFYPCMEIITGAPLQVFKRDYREVMTPAELKASAVCLIYDAALAELIEAGDTDECQRFVQVVDELLENRPAELTPGPVGIISDVLGDKPEPNGAA